jgi:hypothetical protein
MGDAVVERPVDRTLASDARLGLIAGGVISSYRASLVDRDLWEPIRALFEQRGPYTAEWLDAVSHRDWVPVEAFVSLLDVMGQTMGVDALRSLVRKRMGDPAGSNFYAPILRSWARSFGQSPEHMLRCLVHVWRASLRNAGQLRHHAVRHDEVHLLIEGPLEPAYRSSAALSAQLEGLAFSLIDSAHPRPVFVEVELRTSRAPLALVCQFHN